MSSKYTHSIAMASVRRHLALTVQADVTPTFAVSDGDVKVEKY